MTNKQPPSTLTIAAQYILGLNPPGVFNMHLTAYDAAGKGTGMEVCITYKDRQQKWATATKEEWSEALREAANENHRRIIQAHLEKCMAEFLAKEILPFSIHVIRE